jgi:outer membrane protein TolC
MDKMKCFLGKKAVFVIASLLLCNSVSRGQEVLRLSLEKALEIAQSENPTIKVADKEIEKKQYAKKGVIAGLFPNINASGGYTYTIKKQVFAMMGQNIKVGQSNNWNAGLSLSLPIFAPMLTKSIELSAKDVELAVESARSSKQDLVNQVTKAYYQLLLAQDSYEVLKKSYAHSEANYEVVNNKFKQGVVSEYDKIRAEVQVRNLKPSVISAENAVNLTKLQLKVLIGLDANQKMEIEGNLANYENSMYAEVLNVDTTTIDNNTQLRQMKLQSEMLDKQLQINKSAYLPSVVLSSQFSYVSMNEDFKFGNYKWNPYSTVGFSLSIPIFDGNARSYKVKQTKLQMEQLSLNKLNLRRSLDVQMKNYMDNIQKSIEQVGSNKESVKQAEKGCLIAQKRYEVGKGTILELNDSELALTQSKLSYNQSIFDYLSAKADLEKVLGKDRILSSSPKTEELKK